MSINVKVSLAGEDFNVDISPYDTIDKLKQVIAQKHYNSVHDSYLLRKEFMVLKFRNTELTDKKLVQDCGMFKDCNVEVICRKNCDGMFQVTVKENDRISHDVKVHREFTVEYLKYLIAQQVYNARPKYCVRIDLGNSFLNEDMAEKKLGAIGVTATSVLRVQYDGMYAVPVKLPNGSLVNRKAHSTDSRESFKSEIANLTKQSADDLSFTMEDDQNILRRGSMEREQFEGKTITVAHKVSGGSNIV